MFALFNLGGGEIILILALILVLFGAKKLPELAKGLGQGIKEFKKATHEVTDEVQRSLEDNNSYSPPPPRQLDQPETKPAGSNEPEKAAAPAPPTEPRG